jgi:hypothetical protein
MFCLAFTLVFLLALSHVLCLALLLVLCLSSLMDLIIAHMVLVHERTALSLDALITAHVLIVVTVSRFVPQNQQREVGVGHTSRSSGLLGVEASMARVSQFGLKTNGGMTMGSARGTITEVASEAS